ncbi:hypothetical protein ASPZODRAFT_2111388 [Penicilliopsis zonata CBS 506.65]|uniref:AB hydrolase-1 domain-containing protein n=1 Tax=Penicilliopsis zonata CBS 506.65 TaxID=1073090 RepID=A0A1L9SBZ8_9EURO|nr:hypothetical protein ASPZODRAFT_2111388 [Penicilliopsis zonata CBS 506.65]OJJ44617.1 hypothetical protein ASPZODRAFT_2111388 [Penicilliopsis zonata CBS 506.65]
MVELQSIFQKAYWSLMAGGLAYVAFVLASTSPKVQRFALYANRVNPTAWQDINDVESFGFLRTQVQPFSLRTPDNETVYGWHILPLHLCREHEEVLSASELSGPAEDYSKTAAFKLLAEDPNARVVISFHGNAAHLASAQRPETHRMLLGLSTPLDPVHVFTIDYRGFGLSTGSPTEEGLITDGVSLLNFLTSSPLNVPPSRIAIIGQSLGTAVSAAVTERFYFGHPDPTLIQPAISDPEPFAGVVLVASFSKISSLIKTYSLKGLTPPLYGPLLRYPRLESWISSLIVDTWDTAARVARLTGIGPTAEKDSKTSYAHKGLDLTIIHALNDADIPWFEGHAVWKAATNEGGNGSIIYEKDQDNGPGQVRIWERDVGTGKKRVRWERVGYGGHNRVATFSVASLAVLRAFEE